ncbi:MAG: hypothetical protein ACTHN5_13040 [Phycisphaerae bacterium]
MTTTPLPISTTTPTHTPALRLLLTSLATGALLGLLLGTAECYAHTIPNEPLMATTEVLATLTFSTALGLTLARLFRKHASPKPLTRGCTLAACLLAYYTAWIGWIANFVLYFSHNPPLPSFFTPARILTLASSMNRLGTWTLFHKPAHGPLLTCIWFAELFTLFTLTTRLVEWKTKPARPTAPVN